MKLALHRSIIFWSGILALAFIGWAWWDSLKQDSIVGYGSFYGGHCHSSCIIGHAVDLVPPASEPFYFMREPIIYHERMEFQYLPSPAFLRGGGQRLDTRSPDMERLLADKLDYLERVEIDSRYRPRENWQLFIPHWLILAMVMLAWIALLLWRARRRSTALARQDESAA